MAAPIALQRPQHRYIGPEETTPRNQTLRKIAAFGVLLGLGLLFAHFWVGLSTMGIAGLAYRYLSTIDSSAKLVDAVEYNRGHMVKWLLFCGANPNYRPTISPLMQAAGAGYCPIMRDLLAAGADPNLRWENNKTPLSVAASQYQDEAVAILLDAGADPTIRRRHGQMLPLDYALRQQQMLHERGVWFQFEDDHPLYQFADKRATVEQRIAAADRTVELLRPPAQALLQG